MDVEMLEIKRKVAETRALAEENNKMLHSMRRHARWATFISLLWWAFIIGSSIAAYYYLQPYIEQIQKAYGSIQNFIGAPH